MNRDIKIKRFCDEGLSLKEISDRMKIKYETVRSICKRNNFNYFVGSKGRQLGSYDKKPRKRRSKKEFTGGSNNSELEKLLKQIYSDVENSNIDRSSETSRN